MVCVRKRMGGVPWFYKNEKRLRPNNSEPLLNLISMEDDKNSIYYSLTKTTTSQKYFCISVFKMKSSSTCLISASLCEGPIFYFNVESVHLSPLSQASI